MRRDKAEVAAAAAGRWRWIVLSVCRGLSGDALAGTHERPCPKCGGNTRFRPWDDFDERGGVRCSHCFAERNADGFATIQWANDCTFVEALNAVADLLNIPGGGQPAGGKAAGVQSSYPEPPVAEPEPSVDWSTKWNHWSKCGDGRLKDMVSEWVKSRPPIRPEAVLASEVMAGNWPARLDRQVVLGFYGYSDLTGPPNALLLYRADGSLFPEFAKLKERKTHLVGGSSAGWIHVGGRDRTARADVIWRVEGLPDGLALLPLLPAHHAIVTPSCGCGWNTSRPEKNPSVELWRGKVLVGVGDADEPGQRGLMRFMEQASAVAKKSLVLKLPFPVVETHGKDLRDWLAAGADLDAIHGAMMDYSKLQEALDVFDLSDPEEPASGVLANYWMDGKRFVPRPIEHVVNELWEMTDNWPRRVGDKLFVHVGDEVSWLANPASLIAWFGLQTGATVDFSQKGGVFSKSELFEALQQTSVAYKSVDSLPHEPPISGHYYTCGDYPDGDGEHLTWLLDRFCVADPLDRQLILLLMATVFWGGGGGQRPIFLITANGTGAGKTTLASIVGELAGGMISIGQRDNVEKITERMLTNEGRDKRILFVDNIKATRFSSADIEQLVTAPVISGRELYKGESQRPNNLTWVMTMNGVGTGKDIAERTILIELRRPEYSGKWTDETMAYVREHRREIICDLLTFLRGPREKLKHSTRWGPWDDGVVSRLPDPDPVMELIRSRQRAVDVDADEALLVQDYFRKKLEDLRYEVAGEWIFIPSAIANKWHCEAINERMGVQKTVQWLRTQIEQGVLLHLNRSRSERQRGFVWQGEDARTGQDVLDDLEHRIEMDKKTSGGFVPS